MKRSILSASPPLTHVAKARKKRARAPLSPAEKARRHEAWLTKMREMGLKYSAKAETARLIAALPPMPNPRETLLSQARGGDDDAQWRADELYGMSWRAEGILVQA